MEDHQCRGQENRRNESSGVNSRFFEPGPYSLQEAYAGRFVEWYLEELQDVDAGT